MYLFLSLSLYIYIYTHIEIYRYRRRETCGFDPSRFLVYGGEFHADRAVRP